MGIITLRKDGSQDQLTIPGLDDHRLYSKSERSKRIRYILSRFQDTFHTESAMYLAFYKMPEADRTFLSSFWNHENDWETFRHLCRHFKVKVA